MKTAFSLFVPFNKNNNKNNKKHPAISSWTASWKKSLTPYRSMKAL